MWGSIFNFLNGAISFGASIIGGIKSVCRAYKKHRQPAYTQTHSIKQTVRDAYCLIMDTYPTQEIGEYELLQIIGIWERCKANNIHPGSSIMLQVQHFMDGTLERQLYCFLLVFKIFTVYGFDHDQLGIQSGYNPYQIT